MERNRRIHVGGEIMAKFQISPFYLNIVKKVEEEEIKK